MIFNNLLYFFPSQICHLIHKPINILSKRCLTKFSFYEFYAISMKIGFVIRHCLIQYTFNVLDSPESLQMIKIDPVVIILQCGSILSFSFAIISLTYILLILQTHMFLFFHSSFLSPTKLISSFSFSV